MKFNISLWCLFLLGSSTGLLGQKVTVKEQYTNKHHHEEFEVQHPGDSNVLTKTASQNLEADLRKASSEEAKVSGKVLHHDLLKLYRKVLKELLNRDKLKRKLEVMHERLDRVEELFNRVEQIEEQMQMTGEGSFKQKKSSVSHHDKLPNTESGGFKVDKHFSSEAINGEGDSFEAENSELYPPEETNDPLADLKSRVSRADRFLRKVAVTLKDHSQQLEELQNCNVMHGDLLDTQNVKMEVFETELNLHKAKIESLKVDDHWQKYNLDSVENSTRSMMGKVHEIDKVVQGLLVDQEMIEKKIDSMSVFSNGTKCSWKCENISDRIRALERSAPKVMGTQSPDLLWRPSTTLKPSTIAVNQQTFKMLLAMNESQRDQDGRLGALKQTVKTMDLDISGNSEGISKLSRDLSRLYYQLDKLREADNKRTKRQRKLERKVRTLLADDEAGQELDGNLTIVTPSPDFTAEDILYNQNKAATIPVAKASRPNLRKKKYVITPEPRTSTTTEITPRQIDPARYVTKFQNLVYDGPSFPRRAADGWSTEAPRHSNVIVVEQTKSDGSKYMEAVHPDEENLWNTESVVPQEEPSCELQRVGKAAVEHTFPKTVSGWWGRDTADASDSVYAFLVSYKAKELYEYENLAALHNDTVKEVHHLPFSCSGTGHMVYRGSLYCNKFGTSRVIEYNLATKATKSRRLPDAGFMDEYPYSFGAFSDIDIAVDEHGMWAVYGSHLTRGNLTLAELDLLKLRARDKWDIPFHKTVVGNTFMMCGKLYLVAYSSSKARISHVFDTKSGVLENLPEAEEMMIEGEAGDYPTMLDYNPRDRKLYAWHLDRDWNGRLVTYDIVTG